ncbi:hypothetical protein ITP53_15620 [Nonomuraea sp. K274]|uniref:DUF8094 domain-containing protein n=1 Tax=Nonomuraea cypriaca TaxID=1187855 RepID=A0A931A8V7_9ACTN|nr:hypothetical protein [Nonomuraea cypriaca]MBF8187140.1 hypothetical protein [Nonomuraea cypriaca]
MTIRPLPVALLALALSATACSTGGQATSSAFGGPSSAAPAEPRGVVSATEARAILDQWDKATKEARRQGGTDWSAADAGLAAQISTAESKLLTTIGESVDTPAKAIVKPRFAIPGKVAGEPWFMAEYNRKGTKNWHQGIFKKTPAGWRMVAMSVTPAKSRPPAAARDKNGLATVLAADDRTGLIASPQGIVQAHARLQNTFGENRGAGRLFLADSYARERARLARTERKTVQANGEWTLTIRSEPAPEIYALRTAAGGALVWYGITQQNTMTARPGATSRLHFSDRNGAALSHGERFKRKTVQKTAGIYLAVVPRSPGLVRVPTEWFTGISITGS